MFCLVSLVLFIIYFKNLYYYKKVYFIEEIYLEIRVILDKIYKQLREFVFRMIRSIEKENLKVCIKKYYIKQKFVKKIKNILKIDNEKMSVYKYNYIRRKNKNCFRKKYKNKGESIRKKFIL